LQPSNDTAALPRYTHAVVMGDLVSSETAPSASQLHQIFNAAIDDANREARLSLASPLTITLGDEFQGLCATLSDGLAVLRWLRARLLMQGVECRFVLGAIILETPINRERAWNMMGPGLAASRERLGDKRDGAAYRFVLPGEPVGQILMDAVGAAITDIEHNWTDRQRDVILSSADEPASKAAERLRMSPQTFYKIRRAGRYDLYERQWTALTASAAALDATYGLT
jgi:hypothetical protein